MDRGDRADGVLEYRFLGGEIRVAEGCLTRGGVEHHLRQKTFQVLVYLIEHRHRIVTKDELLSSIWPDTAVTEDGVVQCVVDIRRALGDSSRESRFIRTIPKIGYRFIATPEVVPIAAEAVVDEAPAAVSGLRLDRDPDRPVAISRNRRLYRGWLAASLTLAAASVSWLAFGRDIAQTAERPADVRLATVAGKKAVAVMFFENQSATRDLEWLREGLADMLITELSRSPGLNVLSRQQLTTLMQRIGHEPNTEIELEEALTIAARTGAEAVMLGSFAELGGKVRIDVTVHDGTDGRMLASERLVVDGPERILTDLDLLSLKLSTALGGRPRPPTDVAFSQVMTDNLQAYRYYSLGLEKANAFHSLEAIDLFEKAIALDPQFAMAHARIGYAYTMTWVFPEKALPYLERAFRLQDRLSDRDRLYISAWYALAKGDPIGATQALKGVIARYAGDVEAYIRLGRLLAGEERSDEAIDVLMQGLAVDPESAEAYHILSNAYSEAGRHADAIRTGQRYVALAPEEPNAYDALGLAYQWAGEYEKAIAEYQRALALKEDFDLSVVHLANSYFQLGRYAEALERYGRYIKVAPSDNEKIRAHRCMSLIYQRLGQVTRARGAAKEEEADTQNGGFAVSSVLLAMERGDRTTVNRLMNSFRRTFGVPVRGARPFLRLGEYLKAREMLFKGDVPRALDGFRQAVSRRPPTWDIDPLEDCLALAYLQMGRTADAIAELERILRLNPRYPLARYHLALAYAKTGRRADSRTELTRFLRDMANADANVPEVMDAKLRLSGVWPLTTRRIGRTEAAW